MTTGIKAAIDPAAGTMALVKQAQAAYAAGRDREWAGALWMAGEGAVRQLAKSRGIAAEGSIVAVLKQLDEQDEKERGRFYSRELGGLTMLEIHYQGGALESYWWEDLHNDVVAFIAKCHEDSGQAGAAAIRALRCPTPARRKEEIVVTTRPKIAIDPEAAPLELVQQAQAAYDAGRDHEWAAALWQAGERAVRQLARSRGITAADTHDILNQLDECDTQTRDRYYIVNHSSLRMLRTHYQLGVLESYWWDDLHNDVVAFINHCHAAAT